MLKVITQGCSESYVFLVCGGEATTQEKRVVGGAIHLQTSPAVVDNEVLCLAATASNLRKLLHNLHRNAIYLNDYGIIPRTYAVGIF